MHAHQPYKLLLQKAQPKARQSIQAHLVRKNVTMRETIEIPMNFSRSLHPRCKDLKQQSGISHRLSTKHGTCSQRLRSTKCKEQICSQAANLNVRPPITIGDCRTKNRYTHAMAKNATTNSEVGWRPKHIAVTKPTNMR